MSLHCPGSEKGSFNWEVTGPPHLNEGCVGLQPVVQTLNPLTFTHFQFQTATHPFLAFTDPKWRKTGKEMAAQH